MTVPAVSTADIRGAVSGTVFRDVNNDGIQQGGETGISGVTDIELTKGLKPGDEIVVGSYKALRTLKPASSVKVDNTPPKKPEEEGQS